MSNWKANKRDAIFNNTEPSLTDQSAANGTDVNVIVRQFGIHGQLPGATKQPLYEDWTQYPSDLRGLIEASRKVSELRASLPDQLKNRSIDELMSLTPEQLNTILTPPQTPEPTPDATKGNEPK